MSAAQAFLARADRRGGHSAGKKAGIFLVHLPDGTAIRKHAFNVRAEGIGAIFQKDGIWYCAGIVEPTRAGNLPQRLAHHTAAKTTRIG